MNILITKKLYFPIFFNIWFIILEVNLLKYFLANVFQINNQLKKKIIEY